jgi:hypothetical protein
LIVGRRDRWVGERISGGGIGRRRGFGIGIVGGEKVVVFDPEYC